MEKCELDEVCRNNNAITLTKSDHEDMKTILETVVQTSSSETGQVDDQYLQKFGLSEKMSAMVKSQLANANKTPKARRWDTDIIRLCLTLYCRSPKNYEFLAKGGYFVLPSSKLIRLYKNKIDQKAGVNKDVFEWMKSEAELQDIPDEGYEGGLILDEMTIQEDLQMKRSGNEFELIGIKIIVQSSFCYVLSIAILT